MHRLSMTAVIGILTLTIGGCGSGNNENNTATTTSTPKSTQPAPKPLDQPKLVAQNSENKEPSPEKKEPLVTASTAGLIQSTNPIQRTQQVQKGRSDPFAGLFVVPKIRVAAPQKVVPPLPKLPVAPPVAKVQPIPKPAPLPPPAPIAPPQPDLARGVTVLGVVEVGSQFQAIVKVPNEAASRYVSQGQRLSDGQILVKRIEIFPGSDPLVILEQNGIEVTRAVGEVPAKQDASTTRRPISSIPTSQSTNSASVADMNSLFIQTGDPATIPVPSLPKSKSSAASVPAPPESQSDSEIDYPPEAIRVPSPMSTLPTTQLTSQAQIDQQQLEQIDRQQQINQHQVQLIYRQKLISRLRNRR